MTAEAGGTKLAGSSTAAVHGVESTGSRANHRSPSPIRIGPATRKRREPIRPATVPIRVDRVASMIPTGMPMSARPECGVAEHALEHDRLVEERDVEGAIDEERHQVDRRERPRPEDREGDERIGPPGHQDRERDQRDDSDRDRDPGREVLPLVGLAADDTECQPADRECRDERSEPVEPAGRLGVARLLDVSQGRPQGEPEERDVDQEGDPPADGVDEEPAEDRSDYGQGGCRCCPDAERAARAGAGGGCPRRSSGSPISTKPASSSAACTASASSTSRSRSFHGRSRAMRPARGGLRALHDDDRGVGRGAHAAQQRAGRRATIAAAWRSSSASSAGDRLARAARMRDAAIRCSLWCRRSEIRGARSASSPTRSQSSDSISTCPSVPRRRSRATAARKQSTPSARPSERERDQPQQVSTGRAPARAADQRLADAVDRDRERVPLGDRLQERPAAARSGTRRPESSPSSVTSHAGRAGAAAERHDGGRR